MHCWPRLTDSRILRESFPNCLRYRWLRKQPSKPASPSRGGTGVALPRWEVEEESPSPGADAENRGFPMTQMPTPFNVMIAHAEQSGWAWDLGETLASLPLRLHWPQTGEAAIRLAATRRMHLAVVDDELPEEGGRGVVQSIRRLGLELPCLLVCRDADPRVLRDAMELGVFSVLDAGSPTKVLTPTILNVVRRIYRVDWCSSGDMN